MKNLIVPVLLMLCLFSCQKADRYNTTNQEYSATLLNVNSKSATYSLTMLVGHLASECKGCVTMNGLTFHMDCTGYGNACAASTTVNLVQISGNNYTATTIDSTVLTNEAFFNMPSRSLFVEYDDKNNEVWLNIPAQLVFRDSVSHQFTFTGLYYSNSQIYEND